MTVKIESLKDQDFYYLFSLTDVELEQIGAVRMTVDEYPGFPCRVSLKEAEIGEEVILLPFQHHKTSSPYQASGPIFVRKIAKTAMLDDNEIPQMLVHRLLSLRGYDESGYMKDAVVIEGKTLKEQILRMFENIELSYIHIHNARPGCYNCKVLRA